MYLRVLMLVISISRPNFVVQLFPSLALEHSARGVRSLCLPIARNFALLSSLILILQFCFFSYRSVNCNLVCNLNVDFFSGSVLLSAPLCSRVLTVVLVSCYVLVSIFSRCLFVSCVGGPIGSVRVE